MKKMLVKLNVLLAINFILIAISFFILFFNSEIVRFVKIDNLKYTYILSFFIMFFFTILYYKIRYFLKDIQQKYNNNILEIKKCEQKYINFKNQLYIDKLTGLPNRDAIQRDIKHMKNPKSVILDIDSFKDINEYYGSGVGDIVLYEVSQRLQNFLKNKNISLYRMGADKFALLEDSSLDIDRYEKLIDNLINLFKKFNIKITKDEYIVNINVTLGLSFERENTIEKAEFALKEAKLRQIDYLCYFKELDKKSYIKEIEMIEFINKSIENSTIAPYYQPIFNRDKKIIKYEALVRILDTDREILEPKLFLEIARKIKRYAEIEKIQIQKSFASVANTDKIISVNLLARDMSDGNVSNFIISMLNKYGVSKQIIFEILENENIEDLQRVNNFLVKIRKMGCKIAIDDFGTGYSNFSYLTKLNPDYIKIDGSLIRNLPKDKNANAIVTAIVTFAKKLDIKIIAEYVHSEEVFEICKKLGVDEFQGFYLGHPISTLT